MPLYTELQTTIYEIIKDNLVNGKCTISTREFKKQLKEAGLEPHICSIFGAIKALEKKGRITRLTEYKIGAGKIRTLTVL